MMALLFLLSFPTTINCCGISCSAKKRACGAPTGTAAVAVPKRSVTARSSTGISAANVLVGFGGIAAHDGGTTAVVATAVGAFAAAVGHACDDVGVAIALARPLRGGPLPAAVADAMAVVGVVGVPLPHPSNASVAIEVRVLPDSASVSGAEGTAAPPHHCAAAEAAIAEGAPARVGVDSTWPLPRGAVPT